MPVSSLLIPSLYSRDINDIDLEGLLNLGIRGLIFDLDNTLVKWGTSEITEQTWSFVENARHLGFKMCILSNNFSERSKSVADSLDIPGIGNALKPSRKGFLRAVDLMGLDPKSVAVIGDQIFTDTLGGNRSGMFTILVNPLWAKEFPVTRVVRLMERLWLRSLKRKGHLRTKLHT